ncbi:replication initiation protein [uncultured Cetobacterium sp.]|uniref:replication initiation protein n=1 Tax=uncultured Cetobacterium sp. TaxID=527638 RepID=UPI002602535E|nr:replication initiation protein [uncultured Cetobacterium sp.]
MEIVKYHNDINKLKIGNFTELEIDIFFSLLLKARDEKENKMILEFSEFKSLIDVKNRSETRLIKNIRGLNLKLKSLVQEVQDINGDYVAFSLFGDIVTSPTRKVVEVEINPRFKHLIKEIMGEFTFFELKELVELRGGYSKTLFRLLKQWESTGEYIVKIDDFREIMGIPKTYLMKNIRQKIFKPCLEELGKSFDRLELTELKKGRNVETLVFTWKSKKEKKKDNIIDVQPVKKKKIVLGEKDLQEHEREQFENTIQELEKDKKIKNISNDPIVKLIKITRKDYEDLYKNYLEQLGEEHNHFIRKSFDFINKAKYEVIEDIKKEYVQTKIYTAEDIDESLVVSKTGKKLVGMARQHKIKKLLEEMNKGEVNV